MASPLKNISSNYSNNLLDKFDNWIQKQITEISEPLTQFIDKYFPNSFEKIVIDEKLYLFHPTDDLSKEQFERLRPVLQKGWFERNELPIVDSYIPPPNFSEQEWPAFIINLRADLEDIHRQTTFLYAEKVSDRFGSQIQKVIARTKPPTSYGTSTYSKGEDDPPNEPDITHGYAFAYGVTPESITPISIFIYLAFERPININLDFTKKTNPNIKNEAQKIVILNENQEILSEDRLIQIESTESFYVWENGKDKKRSEEYFEKVKKQEAIKNGAAIAFLKKYKPEIDRAIQILSQNHPDLAKENLTLAYDQLIRLELAYMDEIDLVQDAAASRYAEVPQSRIDLFEKYFPSSVRVSVGFSSLGSSLWRLVSWKRGVPIVTQGLGPLQIIPGIALSAFQNKPLFDSYSHLVTKEDFKDEKAIIRAIFDPQKMFAVKAMTWDLQLRELKKFPEILTTRIIPSPHINGKNARELALLEGARYLVQFPEKTNEVYKAIALNGYTGFIASIAQMGENLGVTLQLAGVKYFRNVIACPPFTLSYFEDSNNHKTCLSLELENSSTETKAKQKETYSTRVDKSFSPLFWFLKPEKEFTPLSSSSFRIVQKAKVNKQSLTIQTDVAFRYEDKKYDISLKVFNGDEKKDVEGDEKPNFEYSTVSSDPRATRLEIINSLNISSKFPSGRLKIKSNPLPNQL